MTPYRFSLARAYERAYCVERAMFANDDHAIAHAYRMGRDHPHAATVTIAIEPRVVARIALPSRDPSTAAVTAAVLQSRARIAASRSLLDTTPTPANWPFAEGAK